MPIRPAHRGASHRLRVTWLRVCFALLALPVMAGERLENKSAPVTKTASVSPRSGPGAAGSAQTPDGGPSQLNWGASCNSNDGDYALDEGTLGAHTSHVPKSCDTGGATSIVITPAPGNTYYLVVPRNGAREGS